MDEKNGLNQNNVGNGLDRSNNKKSKRNKILIIILAVVTLIAIGITVWALFFRNTTPVSNSDYAPQQVESNAEKIEDDDNTEKLEQQSGGGAVSLTYSNTVTLSLSTKEAALMFQNPARSNQDMKLEIVIAGKAIVVSGKLEPGYKVDKLTGVDTDKLSAGTYEGKFIVSYYNADSGEKAVVNTEIPVTITVKD